ncbi:MAG TPA: response regulator [Dongiaceae bacterium]|nr:response regulator [Dongiaceae bacterium]
MNDTPTLLLIDDDALFLQTLGRSLQRRGANIASAIDADGALAHLQQQMFDLILLDLNLNGASGLKLLQQILKAQPDARVVMLTAYASVATAVDAIKRGAENYLCKPVTTQDILALLEDDTNGVDSAINDNATEDGPLSVDRLEWEHLQRILREHDGNISATARALNMHRRTLQRKLQKRPVSK